MCMANVLVHQEEDPRARSSRSSSGGDGTFLRRHPWSVLAATLSIGSFFAVVKDIAGAGNLGIDFGVFHAGGTLISDQGYDAAYDTGGFSSFFAEAYFPSLAESDTVSHFISTPTFGWFAQGLAAFPFTIAFWVWTVVGFAVLVPACRVLELPRWVPLALAVSPMMAFNTALGQTGPFVLLLFALWHVAHRDSRLVSAGLLGGLLILKPPLAFGYGLLWLIQSRRYGKSIAVAAGTGLVLSIPTFVAGIGPWRGFLDAMIERTENESAWAQQSGSVSEFVKLLTPGAPSWVTVLSWIVGFFVAGGLLVVTRRRFGEDHELLSAAAVIATIIASPHLLIYDSLILVIPAAVAYRRGVLTGDRAGLLGALIVGSIALGPVLFEIQFGLIGRGIGVEFLALIASTILLGRWIEEAKPNTVSSAVSANL